jgi:Glycosyltransferase Family 4
MLALTTHLAMMVAAAATICGTFGPREIMAFRSPAIVTTSRSGIVQSSQPYTRPSLVVLQQASIAAVTTGKSHTNSNNDAPPLKRNPSRKICLMVEPTPFTHVSGYANRFKEMLKFLKKAGDEVDILTVDSKTPSQDLPKEYQGYPVSHTQGFTFPLYNHISLTIDLPEMKGAQMIEKCKPDIIHVTSPGFLLFAAMFYARVMKIPLVMSYHTHLPSYGKCTCSARLGSSLGWTTPHPPALGMEFFVQEIIVGFL